MSFNKMKKAPSLKTFCNFCSTINSKRALVRVLYYLDKNASKHVKLVIRNALNDFFDVYFCVEIYNNSLLQDNNAHHRITITVELLHFALQYNTKYFKCKFPR